MIEYSSDFSDGNLAFDHSEVRDSFLHERKYFFAAIYAIGK